VGLSAREQQALESMADALGRSDPGLASMLATFNRLNADAEMPARGRIRAGWRRIPGRRQPGRREHHPGGGSPQAGLSVPPGAAGRHQRRRGWQQLMLLLWLLASIVLIAVAITISRNGGSGACPRLRALATCTEHEPAHVASQSTYAGPLPRQGLERPTG
jgi:hypothetical protein